MKTAISFVLTLLLLLGLLVAYLVVSLLPSSFGRRTGWVLLGERRLGPEPDRAAIPLSRRRRPRALQLHVLRAAAGLRALTLRFADGGTQVVALDQTLPPGAPSRIIDLPRSRPALESLELGFDPPERGEPDRQPLVRVYGLA